MEKWITITVDGSSFTGKLNETETAEAVAETLPLEAEPNFWGEEVYFRVPVEIDENEEPTEKVEVGELAYWPDDHAFCIFYGPTPSSEGSEPRPASPVTVIGKLSGDPTPLRRLDRREVQEVRVEEG